MYTSYLHVVQAGHVAQESLHQLERKGLTCHLMNGSPLLFLASLTATCTVVVDDSKSAGRISSDKDFLFLRHSVRTETPFLVMVLG